MPEWNNRSSLKPRAPSAAQSAQRAVGRLALAAVLYLEASSQAIARRITSRLVRSVGSEALAAHYLVVQEPLHVFFTGVLVATALWLLAALCSDVTNIVNSVRAKGKVAAPATTKPAAGRPPPSTPPPVASLSSITQELGGTVATGGAPLRGVTSPYTRSASPYSTSGPATSPLDMRRMQQHLALDRTSPAHGPVHPATPPGHGYPSPGGSQPATPASSDWAAGTHAAPYLSPPAAYQYQQLANDAPLPGELPKYHFSLQWSSGGVGTTGNVAVHPSAPGQVDHLLRRLLMNRNDLREWAEQLRYWTSEHVMVPLLQRLSQASSRVSSALQRCGQANTFALRPLLPSSGLWADLDLVSEDDLYRFEAGLLQLQQRAAQAPVAVQPSFSFMAAPKPAPAANAVSAVDAAAAVQAFREYHSLCKVLRGDFPNKGILGNCPPAYLASRIAAFAADSCCGAFKWQGGGPWKGRPWTPDLPTDTHVLLYLVAAFLSAPFWTFEDARSMSLSGGGPFCVGTAPGARVPACTAFLATKPTKDEMANIKSALLVVPGTSGEPLIQLILDGKATITLSGEWAAFEKIVFWLAYIKLELGGKVGPFSLDYLRLEPVIAVVPPDTSVRQRRFFGILS